MKQLPTNICPLHGNPCFEDRCAWWDYAATGCAITSIADGLTGVAVELADRKGAADGR